MNKSPILPINEKPNTTKSSDLGGMQYIMLLPLSLIGFIMFMPFYGMPIFEMDEYKQWISDKHEEYKNMDCTELAVLIMSEELSSMRWENEQVIAETEYDYECLGEKRPVENPVYNHDPRSKR